VPAYLQFTPTESKQSLDITVRDRDSKEQKAIWGLTRSLVANAVKGVTEGHSTILTLKGVGYRATLDNPKRLSLKLGYPVNVIEQVPEGITVAIPNPTTIELKGADKQAIGQFAATIKKWRKPEPYNGKVCPFEIFHLVPRI